MLPKRDEGWTVEEAVTDEQLRGHAFVSAVVWELDPASTETAVEERRDYVALPTRRGSFLVVRDGATYVGNASCRISSDGRTPYLIGGAALPEYRRQGVYRALLTYRLGLARNHGCDLLTTQARADTSEPILRSFGFKEHDLLPMLVKDRNDLVGEETLNFI